MRRFYVLILILASRYALPCAAGESQLSPSSQPAEMLTIAEKTDYRATARYAEMVQLLEAMDANLPYTTRIDIGNSVEGRTIPALIVADPPISTPEELRTQREANGKLVVLAIGNIHAGEVDGKEALPMVIREATRGSRVPLLQRLILIIAPIYNCDGNERISVANRPEQNGPEGGVGVRQNAMELDLNRDFIKIEAPETQGLVAAFNRWDPDIFIDLHTTNGSYHRYLLTWEGPKAPAGDIPLLEFVRDRMLPAVAQTARQRYDLPTFVYGDFADDHTRWVTYPAEGRYSTTYFGLRGRIGVLSESYSYASYRERIRASRDFVLSVLEYAAENHGLIRRVLDEADERAMRGATNGEVQIAIQTDVTSASRRAVAAGFVEKLEGKTMISTGEPKDYEVELMTHFQPTRSVILPHAYLVPKRCAKVVENLRRHGVVLREISSPRMIDLEVYQVERIVLAANSFQGHRTARLTISSRRTSREISADYWVIPTAQRLGRLAAYILEPECEDGLTTWNYFDEYVHEGGDFPVLRSMTPILP